MHVTSALSRSMKRLPAVAAGENFSLEKPDGHRPIEDLQFLTDDMLASVAFHDEGIPSEPLAETHQFEEMVLTALDKVGGKLLFQMRLDDGDDCQHVAAITLGEGDKRRIALVVLDADGAMRLEAVEDSRNPIAGLARSYVSLAEAYRAAA